MVLFCLSHRPQKSMCALLKRNVHKGLSLNVCLFQMPGAGEEQEACNQRHINTFPSEILLQIFSYLDHDDYSLLSSELTCTRWKDDIEKNRIYAKKCRQLLAKNPGNNSQKFLPS